VNEAEPARAQLINGADRTSFNAAENGGGASGEWRRRAAENGSGARR
jgi:hypothetical protein